MCACFCGQGLLSQYLYSTKTCCTLIQAKWKSSSLQHGTFKYWKDSWLGLQSVASAVSAHCMLLSSTYTSLLRCKLSWILLLFMCDTVSLDLIKKHTILFPLLTILSSSYCLIKCHSLQQCLLVSSNYSRCTDGVTIQSQQLQPHF